MNDACAGDEELARFAQGLVAGARQAELRVHAERCAACRKLVAMLFRADEASGDTRAARPKVPAPPAAMLEPGTQIDRYVVQRLLGTGGMGVVYAADDPDLDRTIALKVLRHDARSGIQAERLRREAQTLARLSHPNVVAVYEVGRWHALDYVAMECVDGQTLAAWLKTPRRADEVLAMFAQVGRGLAAAHGAGVVHRDVKPSNALIGADGRLRVTDFGLARSDDDAGDAAAPTGASPELTDPGALMGTPAYMSPEQHRGDAVDARSDQFSFCVALYEALYGKRPHDGGDVDAVRAAVLAGRMREPGPRAGVSRRVRAALVRGLALLPDQRFASMDALLAALRPPPRRALAIGAVALVAIAGVTIGYVARDRNAATPIPCRDVGAPMTGVWDPARAAEVEAKFTASGKPYAGDAYTAVAAGLDGYAKAWTSMRRDACQATRVRGDQSDAMLDRRIDCLDGRLDALRAVVDVLADADAAVIARAPEAVAALPWIDACADATALRARVAMPADPEARREIGAIRLELARARAAVDAGRYRDALAALVELGTRATATGYAPIAGEALLALGRDQAMVATAADAEATLREAVHRAEAGGDDETAARALIRLVWVVGSLESRPAEVADLQGAADAKLSRLGDPPELRAKLWRVEGDLATATGDLDAAQDLETLALDYYAAHAPDGGEHISVLTSLAEIAHRRGQYAEAARLDREALDRAMRSKGQTHPDTADAEAALAEELVASGDLDGALEHYRHALTVGEAASGADSAWVGWCLDAMSAALAQHGDVAEAEADLRRALKIREAQYGADSPRVAGTLANLSRVLLFADRAAEAVPLAERALAIDDHVLAADAPSRIQLLSMLADTYRLAGEPGRALEKHREALGLFEQKLGKDHPKVAMVLKAMGDDLLDLDRAGEAIDPLTRALRLRQEMSTPNEIAATGFSLARAEWATHDRKAACKHALAARDTSQDADLHAEIAEFATRCK